MSPMLEGIQKRRSVRRFRPDLVSQELLEQLIAAACWAPSGGFYRRLPVG